MPGLIRAGSRAHAGYHSDLLDQVTGFGAAVRPKLVELCAGFGIPAKLDVAGSSVAALAAQRDYGRIARYCETDVVATWLAAMMWGSLHDAESGIACWRELADWVLSDQPRLAHLLPYAVAVPDGPGGGPMLGDDTPGLIDL